MGSSQSQPSRPSSSVSPIDDPENPGRPSLLHRSSTLRRLGSYARGDSSGSVKRNRAAVAPSLSSSTSRLDSKKARLGDGGIGDEEADVVMTTPDTPHMLPGSSLPSSSLPTPPLSTPGLPTSPGPPIGDITITPPVGMSPRGDPLRLERARSIASIRSVLGADWVPPFQPPPTSSVTQQGPPDTPRAAGTTTMGTPNRARRSSLPSPSIRGGGGEMTAYLGVSAPTESTISSDPPPPPAPPAPPAPSAATLLSAPGTGSTMDFNGTPASDNPNEIRAAIANLAQARAAQIAEIDERRSRVEELEAQIAEAREQLAEQVRQQAVTRSALERAQRDFDEAERAHDNLQARMDAARSAEPAQSVRAVNAPESGEETAAGQIPTGAVLIIQGLAQTRGVRDAEDTDSASTSRGGRPGHRRMRSDSTLPRRTSDGDEGTLEAQARMIGGLLTVAAAATASTLLTPTVRPAPRPQSLTASVVDFVMNRLRPNRPLARSMSNIESALGNYLRGAERNVEVPVPDTPAAASTTSEATSTDADLGSGETTVAPPRADFQRFLELMQMDLVAAVREFGSSVSEPLPPPAEAEDSTTPAESPAIAPAPTLAEGEGVVPTFHPQLGQIHPSGDTSSGITEGTNGGARRLNFFRAHVFPAGASQEDPAAVVPCVFIGVRSISHDPSLTTDDLVRHPSFPFADGQVPRGPPEGEAGSSPTSPFPTPLASTGATSTAASGDRRSFRERVFDRLSMRRSSSRTRGTPLNTYLVYVIGGYYPRNHPVLRIPNLITGGPLTDEEMSLIAELMGPGKPPTATAEEIAQSGLTIVKGADMKRLGAEGSVLESCVERCLICLSDFEDEEDCRVLNCKHGFHKECVDHWLSQGRNNCPACRTEAVAKAPPGATNNVPPVSTATPDPSNSDTETFG